ncbi:MAG: hypothetical protein UT32_C0005G0020 [Parcubacteria group bacterium GW2011_GWC2_39_14]|nr:MAG: hypothetical protein UT32_C0005G0020 [Parcubacteria group bacterium GW2011_GWC2_39_14]KKR54601.1 MAG: hypothetical protein UT91_C0012G0020 [Parcubacteria group bacterium GW2011_GWA2_40_23]
MNKFNFVSGDRTFVVAWEGMKMFAGNGVVQVFEKDQLLGQFVSMDELKAGKMFRTSNGELRVSYAKVFWFIWAIKVELNGQVIKGTQEVDLDNY